MNCYSHFVIVFIRFDSPSSFNCFCYKFLFRFVGWNHIIVVHFEQENVFFFGTFCIILGVDFFSFHLMFLETLKMDFWHKSSLTILIIFQHDSVFSKNFYVFTHLCLFEWKTSSICFLWNQMNGTIDIELKWDNEFICNIWLSTSLSLVIIWMVFKVYFHFVLYWWDYIFFTFFNHLISISNWDFFLQSYYLGFELPYSNYYLQKIISILAW
jgi:hypothetical protein